jgi:hypothetical protein
MSIGTGPRTPAQSPHSNPSADSLDRLPAVADDVSRIRVTLDQQLYVLMEAVQRVHPMLGSIRDELSRIRESQHQLEQEEWLTISEAARKLRISEHSLRAMCRPGTIRARKLTTSPRGRWLVSSLDVRSLSGSVSHRHQPERELSLA